MMGGGWNLVWIKGFRYAFEILNLKRTMDNEYVEDSTDIESMPDIPPRRSSKKAKHLSTQFVNALLKEAISTHILIFCGILK